jgi:uncharacterized protein
MKIAAVAALALAVACGAARADDTIAPERLALAKQVMELSGASKVYDNYDKNLDMMVAQIRQSLPPVDDATIADIKKIAVEEFAAARPQLMDGAIKIYARHFSESDLKTLIAFYKSEAGQHFSAELPAISTECMQLNVPFTKSFMARLQQYIAAKIAAQSAPEDQSKDKKDK